MRMRAGTELFLQILRVARTTRVAFLHVVSALRGRVLLLRVAQICMPTDG